MKRSENCLQKLDRMTKTIRHEEADRVPITDFFWGGFLKKWKEQFGLAEDTDIYKYYDLDWMLTIPNMDPHIKNFEILKEDDTEVLVRTGYEAVLRKKFNDPMPAYAKFETDSLEKLADFQFDDPADERRFFKGGDNQIAGVGDGFARDLPPWIEAVKTIHADFPVYGSVCEAHEQLWRIIGTENVMMWLGLYPEELGRFIDRLSDFLVDFTRAQIDAAGGLLDGMVIFGDVAYSRTMLFSPEMWRTFFRPCLERLVSLCHSRDLPVVYHGCGNVSQIFEDYIEVGVDIYNPLEVKAGLDVVDLRRKYGHRIGFCGNMDIQLWVEGSREQIKDAVLRKLNAAKGGGFIFASDHSVPSNLPPENYEYVLNLVREYGDYPLDLGEYDLTDLS